MGGAYGSKKKIYDKFKSKVAKGSCIWNGVRFPRFLINLERKTDIKLTYMHECDSYVDKQI